MVSTSLQPFLELTYIYKRKEKFYLLFKTSTLQFLSKIEFFKDKLHFLTDLRKKNRIVETNSTTTKNHAFTKLHILISVVCTKDLPFKPKSQEWTLSF